MVPDCLISGLSVLGFSSAKINCVVLNETNKKKSFFFVCSKAKKAYQCFLQPVSIFIANAKFDELDEFSKFYCLSERRIGCMLNLFRVVGVGDIMILHFKNL